MREGMLEDSYNSILKRPSPSFDAIEAVNRILRDLDVLGSLVGKPVRRLIGSDVLDLGDAVVDLLLGQMRLDFYKLNSCTPAHSF